MAVPRHAIGCALAQSEEFAKSGGHGATPGWLAATNDGPPRRSAPSIRGRRLLCRVHPPQGVAGPLPVLVYLRGGGWVLNSIGTHDRLMREYAAAAGCAVVGPHDALSPEAPFPQEIEEAAEVLRRIAAEGAGCGLDGARLA